MKTFRNLSVPHLAILTLLAFMLTSCGDKEEDKKDERSPRLKQLTMQYINEDPYLEETDSVQFLYSVDNQLIAMSGISTDDSIGIQYNPEGRISSVKFAIAEGESYEMTYSWSGNRMTLTESDYADGKAVFEINGDGRVVRMESYFLNEGQWYMTYYMLYTWTEGNLVSTEAWQSYAKSGTHKLVSHHFPFILPELQRPASQKELQLMKRQNFIKESDEFYTYDNKRNPYKEFQLYRFSSMAHYSSANNAISSIRKNYKISGEINETYTNNYTYTYNSENFPLIRSESDFHWSITETYLYE